MTVFQEDLLRSPHWPAPCHHGVLDAATRAAQPTGVSRPLAPAPSNPSNTIPAPPSQRPSTSSSSRSLSSWPTTACAPLHHPPSPKAPRQSSSRPSHRGRSSRTTVRATRPSSSPSRARSTTSRPDATSTGRVDRTRTLRVAMRRGDWRVRVSTRIC